MKEFNLGQVFLNPKAANLIQSPEFVNYEISWYWFREDAPPFMVNSKNSSYMIKSATNMMGREADGCTILLTRKHGDSVVIGKCLTIETARETISLLLHVTEREMEERELTLC